MHNKNEKNEKNENLGFCVLSCGCRCDVTHPALTLSRQGAKFLYGCPQQMPIPNSLRPFYPHLHAHVDGMDGMDGMDEL